VVLNLTSRVSGRVLLDIFRCTFRRHGAAAIDRGRKLGNGLHLWIRNVLDQEPKEDEHDEMDDTSSTLH
jgi:hypothetical protein